MSDGIAVGNIVRYGQIKKSHEAYPVIHLILKLLVGYVIQTLQYEHLEFQNTVIRRPADGAFRFGHEGFVKYRPKRFPGYHGFHLDQGSPCFSSFSCLNDSSNRPRCCRCFVLRVFIMDYAASHIFFDKNF